MAKKLYIGVDNISRKTKHIYIGVDNTARKVVRGYIGVNDKAQQFWYQPNYAYRETSYTWSDQTNMSIGQGGYYFTDWYFNSDNGHFYLTNKVTGWYYWNNAPADPTTPKGFLPLTGNIQWENSKYVYYPRVGTNPTDPYDMGTVMFVGTVVKYWDNNLYINGTDGKQLISYEI